MQIDPKTMLFTGLTQVEADTLCNLAENVVVHGTVPCHPLTDEWFRICGFTETYKILIWSSVFPARALLSVVCFYKKQLEQARR